VRAWLLVEDPERAVADLSDLIEWLHHVYLRHLTFPRFDGLRP
jgi:hypothetical protein